MSFCQQGGIMLLHKLGTLNAKNTGLLITSSIPSSSCFLQNLGGLASDIEGRLSLAIFECTGFVLNVFHSIFRVLFADLGGLASDIEGKLFVCGSLRGRTCSWTSKHRNRSPNAKVEILIAPMTVSLHIPVSSILLKTITSTSYGQ
jgi:hypothetical protein